VGQGLQRPEMQILQDHAGPGVAGTKRWRQIFRQRITVTLLILSDVVVALLILQVAELLQGIWGRDTSPTVAAATTVPAVALWVGLRALMDLYPGYGLDAVQEVRRHTYAALAVLATLAIVAVGFRVSGSLSRLLLVLFFSGLLIVVPFRALPDQGNPQEGRPLGQAHSNLRFRTKRRHGKSTRR
jgi:hypothetical protein